MRMLCTHRLRRVVMPVCVIGMLGSLLCYPTESTGSPRIANISSNADSTIALADDGTVWAWGENRGGALGESSESDSERRFRSMPVRVHLPVSSRSVAIRGRQGAAVGIDGSVWKWGGYAGDLITPSRVAGLEGSVAVAAGYLHTIALTNDGRVYGWGSNLYGALFVPNGQAYLIESPVQIAGLEGIAQIASRSASNLAIDRTGKVFSWGRNTSGQLGLGYLSDVENASQIPGLDNVIGVAVGEEHAVVLRSDGRVMTWGRNVEGQLGDGSTTSRSTPSLVEGLESVVAVAAGGYFTLALRNDGVVFAWGTNEYFSLGVRGTSFRAVPAPVEGLPPATMIAAGEAAGFAGTNGGSVWVWGDQNGIYRGDGLEHVAYSPVPQINDNVFSAVVASDGFSAAIDDSGQVFAWGENRFGQLGDGTTLSRLAPGRVTGIGDAVDVALGDWVGFAVRADGTVWGWGEAHDGLLGEGATGYPYPPIPVSGLRDVTRIAVGLRSAVALRSDGTVWRWGGISGAVAPAIVSGLSRVVDIAAGLGFSLALRDDGTVWSWGDSPGGGLGLGNVTQTSTPLQIPGLADIVSISAKGTNVLALNSNGTVFGWGTNQDQLMNAGVDTAYRLSPRQVSGIPRAVQVSAGGEVSLVLDELGTLWAWGPNRYGALGNGDDADERVPVRVQTPVAFSSVSAGESHVVGLSADRMAYVWGGVPNNPYQASPQGLWEPTPVLELRDYPRVPGRPALTGVSTASGQMLVHFRTVVDTGGSPILDYAAICFSSNRSSQAMASGLSSPIVVAGLANDVGHRCRVRARNAIGFGLSSRESESLTPHDGQTISFELGRVSVVEGNTTVTLNVVRRGGTSGVVSVAYSTRDYSAMAGRDYVEKHGTINFASGVSSVPIQVRIVDDAFSEMPEEFHVVLETPVGGAAIGDNPAVSIQVDDNESSVVLPIAFDVSESAGIASIPIYRHGYLGSEASISWLIESGTAVIGTDVGTVGASSLSGTVRLAPGVEASVISVPIIDNAVAKGDRNFTVTLVGPIGTDINVDRKTLLVRVVEDDKGVQFAHGAVTVSEGVGSAQLQVDRLGPDSGSLAVQWTTANGTGLAGAHFGAAGSAAQIAGTLNWPAGDTTPRTIVIPILDDTTTNAGRTFEVTLSSPVGAALGAVKKATVTIADDDNTVQFSAATRTVSEGAGNLVLSVTRVGGTAAPASVAWATTNGTAVAGADFGNVGDPAARTGTLNWAADDKTNKTISIPIVNNSALSGAGRAFSVILADAAGATLGTVASTAVTIVDDEKGVAFAAAARQVNEGAGSVGVVVNRIGDASLALAVAWTSVGGTAIAGTHYGTRNSPTQRGGTLMWPAGDAGAKTISVPILANTLADGNRKFSLVFGAMPAGFIKGSPDVAEVTIVDDDLPTESMVSFIGSKVVTLEGAGARADLVVHRSVYPGCVGPDCNLVRPVSVRYGTVPGTSLAGSDFVAVSNALLEFAFGETTKSISIALVNDSVAEALETFSVKLSSPSPGLVLGDIPEATIVVRDDDEQFPSAGNWPAGWTVPQLPGMTREIGWHVSRESGAAEGFAALRTDTVMDGEIAAIDTPFAQRQTGEIRFKYRVSSEAGFDWLRLYQCDAQAACTKLGEWSGTANESSWAQAAIVVQQGAHRFRWAYEKDGAVSVSRDAAWIDQVQLPPVLQ